jgi:outer membrane lipoprotein SlyB
MGWVKNPPYDVDSGGDWRIPCGLRRVIDGGYNAPRLIRKRDPALRRLALPFLLLPGLLPLTLAGCSPGYSPNTYASVAAQQQATVQRGVIVGVRHVEISANGAIGAAAGGAVGGVAGAQASGGAVTTALGAVGGALVGGIAGTAAEQAVADTTGWEYIVQETKGALVSVTQTSKVALTVGLHVLVIDGKQARVVPDYTVQIAVAAPASVAKPAVEGKKPDVATSANADATAPVFVSPLPPAPVNVAGVASVAPVANAAPAAPPAKTPTPEAATVTPAAGSAVPPVQVAPPHS